MRKIALATLGGALIASSALTAAPAQAASWNANYVAFGDSYAAGSNLPDASGACLTSPSAYPTLLSKKATSVACSGATRADLSGQITAARELSPAANPNGQRTIFKAQQLTLTLGGNDIGWTSVIAACLAGTATDCSNAVVGAGQVIPGQSAATTASIRQLRAEGPKAQILVTGYPRLFQPSAAACDIGSGVIIQPAQVSTLATLDELANQLNAAIAAGVAASGDPNVKFVPAGTFDGHGICTDDPWINGLIIVQNEQGQSVVSPRSFHPNAAGQQAYAAALRPAL